MSENVIMALLTIIFVPILLGSLCFFSYVFEEQEHRHKIELEKIKQGIFEPSQPKVSIFKKYGIHILIVFLISAIVIATCYFFNVSPTLAKYILELIN